MSHSSDGPGGSQIPASGTGERQPDAHGDVDSHSAGYTKETTGTVNRNIEIKARVRSLERIRVFLLERGARHVGTDRQVDTYFNVPAGRLKIRQGTVEACIVRYDRPDTTGMRRCDYTITHFTPDDERLDGVRSVLEAALGVLVVVAKTRDIYFIDNAKFHLDRVEGLGEFFEIEIIGRDGESDSVMARKCDAYLDTLGITDADLIGESYSDMLLRGG